MWKGQLLAVGSVTSRCFGIPKWCDHLQCNNQCLWECPKMAAGHRLVWWTPRLPFGSQPHSVQCSFERLWKSREMAAGPTSLQWSDGEIGGECRDVHSSHKRMWEKQALATCTWPLLSDEDLHFETECRDLCRCAWCCLTDELLFGKPETPAGDGKNTGHSDGAKAQFHVLREWH